MEPYEHAQSAPDTAAAEGDPAVILSATLYLMSCYACTGCPRLAVIVSRHLQAITRLDAIAEPLRATCRQLCVRWEAMAKAPVPTPAPAGASVASPAAKPASTTAATSWLARLSSHTRH